MLTRHAGIGVASTLLVAFVAGCGAPAPPPADPARAETPEQRCIRTDAMPHEIDPPMKLSGEPAELTREAVEAGVKGPVRARCTVTTKGTTAACEVLDKVPASQERVIQAKLTTWRFRPGAYDGQLAAQSTITEEGELTDCYMVKSLPGLDEAILASLAQRRYTPVIYKGKPQRVFYTFPFTFKLK